MSASAVPLLVAVGCGLLSWLFGAGLRRGADGALLAERVQRHRGRLIGLCAGAIVAQIWLVPLLAGSPGGAAVAPAVGATVLAVMLGNFPTRRRLFSESWGVLAYLEQAARNVVALLGFWLLVLGAPFLCAAAGERDVWVAGVLLVVLPVWMLCHSTVLAGVLGAVEAREAALLERLEAVLARSRAARPRILVFGSDRGGWANAFAAPALHRPVVAFTRRLLQLLDADETAAIFAHEVAHLEHYDRRRLLRLAALQGVLIVVAALLEPLARMPALGGTGTRDAALWLWLPAVFAVLLVQIQRRRRHEAESDARAVELCGDAAALSRALVRLHAAQLVPRRVGADVEAAASHPSLARRLQGIAAAGARVAPQESSLAASAESPPGAALVVRRGSDALVLEADRLWWLGGIARSEGEGEAAPDDPEALRRRAATLRAVRYAELVELRVSEDGGPRLRAVDRDGSATTFALPPERVADVQAWLDRADQQLATAPARVGAGPWVRLAPLAAGLCAVPVAGSLHPSSAAIVLLLLVALAASTRRSAAWLAAEGAMAVGYAAFLLLDGSRLGRVGPVDAAALAGLLAAGAGCVWLANRAAGESAGAPRDSPGRVAAILAVTALPGLAFIGLAARGGWSEAAPRVAEAAAVSPGLFLPLLATGAALLCARGIAWRLASGAALLGGAAILLLGTPLAPASSRAGMLAARAPELRPRPGVLRLVRETTVTGMVREARLSPGGLRLAAIGWSPGGRNSTRFVTDFRDRRDIPEHALEFVDDRSALALGYDGGVLRLRRIDLDGPAEPGWTRELRELEEDAGPEDLVVAGGAWMVVQGGDEGGPRSVAGREGADAVDVRQWRSDACGAYGRWIVADNGTALCIDWRYPGFGEGDGGVSYGAMLGLLFDSSPSSELRFVEGDRSWPAGRMRGVLECAPPRPGSARALCVAQGGEGAKVWAADLAARTVRPVLEAENSPGWSVRGERIALLQQGAVLLCDTAAGETLSLALPPGHGPPTMVALGDGFLAVGTVRASASSASTHLAVYEVLGEAGAR